MRASESQHADLWEGVKPVCTVAIHTMMMHWKLILGILVAACITATSADGITIEVERRMDQKLAVSRVQRVPQHVSAAVAKFANAMDNYKRNTGVTHPMAKSDMQKRAVSSLRMNDISNQLEWAGQVSIGADKKPVYVDFDTGSSDLILDQNAYNPSESWTSKQTSGRFKASYADGTSTSGRIYQDTLRIGKVTGKNIALGVANTIFTKNYESPNQGIGGLAFPSIQAFPKEFKPMFTSLVEQKALNQSIFQFNLKAGSGGTLYFGGIDKSKIRGNVSWTGFDRNMGFYVIDGAINGQRMEAIIDSGTTLMVGPTSEVQTLFKSLKNITSYVSQGSLMGRFDCDNVPTLTFNFAGKNITVGREQTTYGMTKGQCILPIVGQNNLPFKNKAWIVGDVLFQSSSVIFDQERDRLGFADLA